MRNKQQGYTLIELMLVVWGIVIVGLAGVGVYILVHFLSKVW